MSKTTSSLLFQRFITNISCEGENIGMEVVSVCRAVNPGLRVLRAKFSEITRASIDRAMRTLTQVDENVSAAVDCRQELDLRIGAAFTRFQTMRLQKMFPNTLSEKLISYGSCQFPTMGFVVERYKAIENFVSERFWKLKVTHEQDGIRVDFSWKRVRLFHERAVQVYHDICNENPTARVEECRNKPKSKWRPLPLDTVELEKQASRKLRLSAKTTMNIAEKLYTQGYISYPRTETNIFPKEMDLTPLVQAQTADHRWGGFADRIINQWNGPQPRQGKKTDQAHPPIHPIKHTSDLQGDEAKVSVLQATNRKHLYDFFKVYEFIVRHFLACVSRDAVGAETTVNIDIAGEKFVGHGLSVRERNYLEVYIYDRWSDKEIIDYSQIREFQPTSIDIVDSSTEPPRLLTEADLIALMDKHGIGTDATHAEHIETVKSREYVFTEDRDKLVPGKLAMALVEGYDAMGFAMSKPHLRAALETDLVGICEGRKTKDEVLQEQITRYRQVFQTAVDNINKLDLATQHFLDEDPADQGDGGGGGGGGNNLFGLVQQEPVVACILCQSQLVLKSKQSGGWMISCQGYPACRAAPVWLPGTVREAGVEERECGECRNKPRLIRLSVSRQAMAPFFPDQHTGCLGGCDTDLLTVLGIDKLNSGAQTNAPQQHDRRGGGGGGGGARAGGGGGGGGARAGHANTGGAVRGGAMPRQNRGAARGGARGRGGGHGNTQPRGGRGGGGAGHRQDESGYGSFPDTPGDDDGGTVACNCGLQSVKRTVQKEGDNKGREFFTCSKNRDEQCGFFQWADEEPRSNSRPQQNRVQPQQRHNQFNNTGARNDDNDLEINCNCGQPSARRTVQKDGANKGREFFTCSKNRDEQCRFFQWADELDNDRGGGGGGGGHGGGYGGARGGRGGASFNSFGDNYSNTRGRGGGRGGVKRKAADNEGGGDKRQRKCGLCHEPGHTRIKCPMKSDWN